MPISDHESVAEVRMFFPIAIIPAAKADIGVLRPDMRTIFAVPDARPVSLWYSPQTSSNRLDDHATQTVAAVCTDSEPVVFNAVPLDFRWLTKT
jgi:hypothetical protein